MKLAVINAASVMGPMNEILNDYESSFMFDLYMRVRWRIDTQIKPIEFEIRTNEDY